jgi:hypothetical protein
MGSYDIKSKKLKDGTDSWRVTERVYRNGESCDSQVPRSEWNRLGFTEGMTLKDARKRRSDLNAFNRSLTKEEKTKAESQIAAAGRVARVKRIQSILIPDDIAVRFENQINNRNIGSKEQNKRVISHWNRAQQIIADLKLEPHRYGEPDVSRDFYDYCVGAEISLDYVLKIRSVINMWGRFISKTNQTFFEELESPDTYLRNQITESYEASEGFQGESEPLTRMMLDKLEQKFEELPGQFSFIYICFWFAAIRVRLASRIAVQNS